MFLMSFWIPVFTGMTECGVCVSCGNFSFGRGNDGMEDIYFFRKIVICHRNDGMRQRNDALLSVIPVKTGIQKDKRSKENDKEKSKVS
jgi:hypothetical protein